MVMDRSSLEDVTVLVTGISGFLGSHVAASLLRSGYRVRGTVRNAVAHSELGARLAAAAGVSVHPLILFPADLTSDAGWDIAVDGCDYVIHTASPFPAVAPKNAAEVIRPAREGTTRVLRAAARAQIKRVVLTSSVAATNHGTGSAPYTEENWTDVNSRRATPYYRSKTLAERDAWEFAHTHDTELTVINPGVILGPLLEPKIGASVGLIAQLLKGGFRGLPRFGFTIADVRDVADAHIRAMHEPQAGGKRFIVSGDFHWIRQVSDHLARDFPELAHHLPSRLTPDWMVRIMALTAPQARGIIHELGRDLSVDTTRARQVLDWAPRTESDTIRETAQSLIDWGIVRVS